MKDKVQKIREEVERLYNQSLADEKRQVERGLECSANVSYGKSKACKELLSSINSMQEEPVSDDDRIRKAMIDFFKHEREEGVTVLHYGVSIECMIAWLEKQGEQKPNYCHHEVDLSECSEEYRKAYYDGWNNCNMQHSQCKSELDDVVKCLINGMKFYYEDNEKATWGTDKWSMPVKHIIEVLERQGEQKPAEFDDTNAKRMFIKALERVEEQNNKGYKLTDCDKNSWWEDFKTYTSRTIEQKPTDKVEPKYKVGDWVVVDDGRIGRIIECTKDFADVDLEFSCLSTRVNNIRPWTIQDAKDGDVLYLQKDGKEHIIIYKGVIKERFRTFVSAYCAYNGIVDAFCFADVSRYVDIAYGGIMPATKEQRDTLMKAMADDGYEWDAEKKELKKIEQTPVIEMKTPEQSLGIDSDTYNKIVDECVYGEQKPAWKPSEEQMKALKEAVDEHFDIDGGALWHLYEDLKKLMEEDV